MKPFPALFFCLLLPLSPLLAQSSAVFGTANPPPAPAPASVATTGDLRQRLVGTTWSWKWGKRNQKFSFAADGTVHHDFFVARFVVKSPSEIELQLKEQTAKLTFDPACTRYEGIDFNGKRPIHGERLDAATAADANAATASTPAYFGTASATGAAPVPVASTLPAVTAPTPPAVTAPTKATPSVSQPAAGSSAKAAAPSTSQENMKKTLELLKIAQSKLQSSASTAPKAEPLLLVESALDALKQTVGDGRYSGHRVKAMKAIANARTELKAGDRSNKAIGYVNEGTSEVYTCVGISR